MNELMKSQRRSIFINTIFLRLFLLLLSLSDTKKAIKLLLVFLLRLLLLLVFLGRQDHQWVNRDI